MKKDISQNEIKKTFERFGYSYADAMRRSGQSNSDIAKVFKCLRPYIAHQMELFENLTGEILPGNRSNRGKARVIKNYPARED